MTDDDFNAWKAEVELCENNVRLKRMYLQFQDQRWFAKQGTRTWQQLYELQQIAWERLRDHRWKVPG